MSNTYISLFIHYVFSIIQAFTPAMNCQAIFGYLYEIPRFILVWIFSEKMQGINIWLFRLQIEMTVGIMKQTPKKKENCMRRFHSYGPVDKDIHFCVPREKLVKSCLDHIIGEPGKGGHYFTIWAPRQTGKTWLMRQAKQRIEELYPDCFTIGTMSMQGIGFQKDDPHTQAAFLTKTPLLFLDAFEKEIAAPGGIDEWAILFHRKKGIFQKPVILLIDEFDSLPAEVIDQMVTMFRNVYLSGENYRLHGLALIGVKAVLGVDSLRGSPFNIQRSLHVENFLREEVADLFDQYRRESGQVVDADVVQNVFDATNGQPGLVGWFGELLTEKYNPGPDKPIAMDVWKYVFQAALSMEWNNTILNLVKKVRAGYADHVLELFGRSDVPFSLDADWCAYLYMNGVISSEIQIDSQNRPRILCRFSCPFIQKRLYNALALDLIGDRLPIPAVEIMDDLADVLEAGLHLPPLLARYKSYLVRMKAKGLNPFKDQPRRADLHYTEAVGHFHLYAWMKEALEDVCVISPEFPTGNGKVDIHIRCDNREGVIEVKSYRNPAKTRDGIIQAAAYAEKLGLSSVTLALFVPTDDASILEKLSTQTEQNGVVVHVVAIGWT